MERIKPNQFSASRVYFTEFDRVTYSQVAWSPQQVEEIKLGLCRKLKLLSLVKGHVVIAASHLLESELAREIILPYPKLFSERIVVPALRAEFQNCQAFLEAKMQSQAPGEAGLYRGTEQVEMAQLIDASALAVEWNTAETTAWFKSRLLSDLRNTNSLVGLALLDKGLQVPEAMCERLEKTPSPSRTAIYLSAQEHGDLPFRDIVTSYVDFLYYLSGAKAVCSEGILPQENIVDFRLSDLKKQRTPLSEHEVFFKIFVDLVKAATSTHFPTDLLDALTIEDAISLHGIAISEAFTDKYNAIQEQIKAGLKIADPERLILLMEELDQFEQDLRRGYEQALSSELPARFRKLRNGRAERFLHAVASLILTPYGMLVGTRDILVSGLSLLGLEGLATRIDGRIKAGYDALAETVERMKGGGKPVLLTFVRKIKSRYAAKMLGPET